MTTFVLTRSENAKSALKLGFPTVNEESEIPRGSNVIRWGHGMSPDSRSWATVLNKSSALEISTDKLRALQTLATVVKTPEVYLSGQVLPRGHRYVARPASHAEGSEFELIDLRHGEGQRLRQHHATRFIEDTREYRVWFVRDKYLCAKRVPRSSDGQTNSDPCRSKWGYGEYVTIFPKLKEEVAKARQAIPLDFGAMDVLWSEANGKWYFLEINSAPSLDTPTLVRHFQQGIKACLQDAPNSRTNAPGSTQTPREVVEAERPPSVASTRRIERPSVTPSSSSSYEAKMRAKLEAEKRAIDERIYREVFGG